jgi:hypothetical protein
VSRSIAASSLRVISLFTLLEIPLGLADTKNEIVGDWRVFWCASSGILGMLWLTCGVAGKSMSAVEDRVMLWRHSYAIFSEGIVLYFLVVCEMKDMVRSVVYSVYWLMFFIL